MTGYQRRLDYSLGSVFGLNAIVGLDGLYYSLGIVEATMRIVSEKVKLTGLRDHKRALLTKWQGYVNSWLAMTPSDGWSISHREDLRTRASGPPPRTSGSLRLASVGGKSVNSVQPTTPAPVESSYPSMRPQSQMDRSGRSLSGKGAPWTAVSRSISRPTWIGPESYLDTGPLRA